MMTPAEQPSTAASTLLIATGNPHKLEEIRAVLEPLGIHALGLADLPNAPPGGYAEPVEDADSFLGNATIKARAYAAATGRLCLADDAGLEVDALCGEPGVHSAYYAGPFDDGAPREERDRANNDKLLAALAHLPEGDPGRSARFVCVMAAAEPSGRIVANSRGEFPGSITSSPRGSNGFGYDPLLQLPDDPRTSAELSPEEKNARSHRGAAARAIAPKLREVFAAG